MRRISFAGAAFVSFLSLEGCMPRELPPAAPPARVVPDIPSLPTEPPATTDGRLLLDSVGGPAVVSLATPPAPFGPGRVWMADALSAPSVDGMNTPSDAMSSEDAPHEPAALCVTPCAVDLPVGAHRLVFTSVDDASRSSVTTVGVSRGTTVVRHAMDQSKPMRATWLVGFLGAFVGAPVALGGATVAAAGATGAGETPSDSRAAMVAGGVSLAVGGALLVGGILAMDANRGSHRKGATTTFPVSAGPL